MKFLNLFKIYILLYFFYTASAFAAPASGVIGIPEKEKEDNFILMPVIRFDHQKNIFKKQLSKFLYKDPGSEEDEDPRHYSKTRGSKNFTDFFEFEVGSFIFNNTYIFGKAGGGRFYTELQILDESFKGLYQPPDLYKITDDNSFMYGLGLSFKIFEKKIEKIFKKIKLNLSLDYKKLYVDVKNHGQSKVSYKAEIDEINTSLLFTGILKNKKIFAGPRVSNITGSDSLKVNELNFHYDDSIKTFRNIGWLFGLTFFKNDSYSLTLQKRVGDEEGISFETTYNF